MKIIRRFTQVRQTVKNVGRMREIAAAMSRFGFSAVLEKLGLDFFIPSTYKRDKAAETLPLPRRVRLLLEDLGPTFIKFGQILASRPDLIPVAFTDEFKMLQDTVKPVPIHDIRATFESSLNKNFADCFASFDTEPIATASIAQVHAARTLAGDDVVVKIKKPGVEKTIQQDLEILELLAMLAETYLDEIKVFRPVNIVREFRTALVSETNFDREVNNMKRFRENFLDSDFLVVPKPYLDLSSGNVITMERIRGVNLSNIDKVREMGVDPKILIARGMEVFYQSVMVDGLFHSDPHGGNILILPDGRMALIDFGSVGILTDKSRRAVISMFLALVAGDFDWLVQEYINLSPASAGSRNSNNVEALQREVSSIFAPYYGLPLREIPGGQLLMEASGIALRHKVTLPRDLLMVFKAIMILEGLGRQMDPEFDMVAAGSKFAKKVLASLYSPEQLLKTLLFTGRDYFQMFRTLPRQVSEVLRQIECGEAKIDLNVKNLSEFSKSQERSRGLLSLSILTAALLFVTTQFTLNTSSLPQWSFITLWTTCGILLSLTLWRAVK
jgi:ubiquinone biosynthesis protein